MRLGTRSSALATTQAQWVAEQLRSQGVDVELVPVQTHGDRSAQPLTEIGGTGVFASALRSALRAGEIDVAVHSLKDLPVAPHPGLLVAAVPVREDPRDAVISARDQGLADLPPGAVVGTGSPRRAGQLAVIAPHLRVVDIRGNVERRIAKVRHGELDAVVLAAAGLRRLGLEAEASQLLDPLVMVPAPGQGALAVECRLPAQDGRYPSGSGAADEATRAVCADLDHRLTRDCVSAERALLGRLEAGCTAPVGAFAQPQEHGLALTAWADLDGRCARVGATGTDPVRLGRDLAEQLLHTLSPDSPKSTLVTERES